MRKILFLLVFAAAAGSAQAQIKCWNQDGKRVCGDTPPPGAKVTTLRGSTEPAAAPAAAGTAAAAKDGAKAKGPLTPAEKEQEYQKRQLSAQKAAEKADAERKAADTKLENCNRAREALRAAESGQRITRVDAKGERYFLDDAEIAKEAAQARQAVQGLCN